MSNELDKLGTILGIQNSTIRETLTMLKEQQKRQVRMIWSSMAIVAMAIVVVGLAIHCTFTSLDKLTEQVNTNTELIMKNSEVIQHGYTSEKSQELPN